MCIVKVSVLSKDEPISSKIKHAVSNMEHWLSTVPSNIIGILASPKSYLAKHGSKESAMEAYIQDLAKIQGETQRYTVSFPYSGLAFRVHGKGAEGWWLFSSTTIMVIDSNRTLWPIDNEIELLAESSMNASGVAKIA
jgi:hypothetical protein